MTDAQLQHRIDMEILTTVEGSLIEAERDRVTMRCRTPDFETYIAGEVARLQTLRTEYLEKTKASREALKTESDAQQKEERDAILRSMGVEPRKEPAWQIADLDAVDVLLNSIVTECGSAMSYETKQLALRVLCAHMAELKSMSPEDRVLCKER